MRSDPTDDRFCFMATNVFPHEKYGVVVHVMDGAFVENGVPIVFENAIVGELCDIVLTTDKAYGTATFRTDARARRAKDEFHTSTGRLISSATATQQLKEGKSYAGIEGPAYVCTQWTMKCYCINSPGVVSAFPKSTEPRPYPTKTTVVRNKRGEIHQTVREPIE